MTTSSDRPTRKRSLAWIYYALIAAVCTYVGFDNSVEALVPAALCAGYSVYLFRGGRFVLWIW